MTEKPSATTDEKPADEPADTDAAEEAGADPAGPEAAPATGPDGIGVEEHELLQRAHPAFAGNWAHLLRLHNLAREKRYHAELLEEWNSWRRDDAVTPDLRGALIHKGNLRECDLHGADLRGARLTECLLGRADLRDADCRETAFRGADMIETQLDGARLHGADFRWVRRTTDAQFAAASGDTATRLPLGIERPADWSTATEEHA